MDDTKTKLELNAEQRAAAYCKENAVVAAGAGSGKTSVLASRFAYLLTEKGYRVDQILTLTFTKKAAAEMYQRIYNTLSEIAANDPGPKGERAREGIKDFIRARIQTLDSYAVSIVKQAASRYGIRPDFTNDNERCRAIAEEVSLPFLIAHRHHPAVERLYPQKSPSGIAGDIFAAAIFNYSYIDGPHDFTEDVKKQFSIICTEWKKLSSEITALLKHLADILLEDGGDKLLPDLVPLMVQFSSGKIKFPDEGEIRSFFDSLLPLSDLECITGAESHPVRAAVLEILSYLGELYALDLRKGKRSDNPAKELIKQFRNSLYGSFSSLAVFCMQAGFILSVMFLLDSLQELYLDKKRAEGVLTFTDVARLARTILRDHPDIRKSEKKAFEAIMIDEFQDNNELQKELLFLLAEHPDRMDTSIPPPEELEPGKLFFVGDEKQSIYRFRGADVSVFRKLKDELAAGDLPLKINYRSAPELIGAFNAIFGGSQYDPMGEKPPAEFASVFASGKPLPLYEASYSPLQAGSVNEGKFTLCVLNAGDEPDDDTNDADQLSPLENEARFTAERIQKLLTERDASGSPIYRPDDIAILFRTHSPQHLFEKHLRLLNIPYASEAINGFFYGGPINDLMSVLRLAAYPLDTEAYAVMLRSPFVGLSLQSLAVCLAVMNSGPSKTPFSDEALSELLEIEQVRFLQGRILYERIRDRASESTLSEMVSELWYAEGYRYETEWNPQTVVYRELYDYLFHLAAKADEDGLGLAGFTDMVQTLREDDGGLEEIDIPLERPGAVRLMTIHKSKGLEFPVVFLCCCGSHGRRGGGSSDVYDAGPGGISFNPPMPPECFGISGVKRNFFYEQSSGEEKRKKTAELRRLLYVAMTRAERELYLTGSLDLGEDENEEKDISLRLKAFVDEKRAGSDTADRIAGDTILDNDTFFGLFLPALADHIPQEGLQTTPSFFSLESIPVYTDTPVNSPRQQGAVFYNDRRGLAAFLKEAAPYYDKIGEENSIITPEIKNNHRTPTLFHFESDPAQFSYTIDKDNSGEKAVEIFAAVDDILKRFAAKGKAAGLDPGAEAFTPADFGTIAHACVDALMNHETPAIPAKLGGPLSPQEADTLLSAGIELAKGFLESPLGQSALSAPLRKSEFRFRSLNGAIFINGTIDLLFEDDRVVYVVDFKTDSVEEPGEHLAQMAFYYRAAMDLLGKPHGKDCQLWLYYLRTGHAVEMTDAAKNLKLEEMM
ncbi:UvrD-helicase domain-containing protein [Treponema primitia]|uniref:UvrD-helicase domain-containing protein n=1 Tax=Treponema primitia TaxID=88058 RepID=UPI000255568B|nr:UvrD-helicase domain-containing protein [Treponema primitia]